MQAQAALALRLLPFDANVVSYGASLNSNCWTGVNGRTFINITLCTWQGLKLIVAIDTAGAYKDADYIADVVCKRIECEGPKNIVAVCMDNALVNVAAFAIIMARYSRFVAMGCGGHIAALLAGTMCKKRAGAPALIDSGHALVMFIKNISAIHTIYGAVAIKLSKKLELLRPGDSG